MSTFRCEIRFTEKTYAGDRDIVDTHLVVSGQSDKDGHLAQALGEALGDLLRCRPGVRTVIENCCRAAVPSSSEATEGQR